MKHAQSVFLLAAFLSTAAAPGQAPAAGAPRAQPAPPPTIASLVDRQISAIEKQVVDAAEAMPEDRFGFSPESLNIPGSAYKGVRTFALQVRHVAASNYALWAPLTGDKIPETTGAGTVPTI